MGQGFWRISNILGGLWSFTKGVVDVGGYARRGDFPPSGCPRVVQRAKYQGQTSRLVAHSLWADWVERGRSS